MWEKTAQLFKVQPLPGSLGYRRLWMQRDQRDAKGLLTDLYSTLCQRTNIKKCRGGPRAPERQTQTLLSIKHPRLQVTMLCHQMEMSKKLINVSGCGLGFRGDKKVSTEQISLEKSKPTMCIMQLKGTWWSEVHLPVEMCPQDKTCWRGWQPCCLFSQNKKALSGLLMALYFSPLNLVPAYEGWGTVARVSSPVDMFFLGC